MVLLMFQESPNLEIYGKVQETGCLPSELCFCSYASFSHLSLLLVRCPQRLCTVTFRGCLQQNLQALHICRDPQCVMFSTPEASQIFQNVY